LQHNKNLKFLLCLDIILIHEIVIMSLYNFNLLIRIVISSLDNFLRYQYPVANQCRQ